MISQFIFENYKAFKNESILDFSAEKIDEYENSLITDESGREEAVPVIAIYGPNGGGKSTVLEALNFLRDTVLRTILFIKLQDAEDKYESLMRKLSSVASKEIYYKLSREYRELPTKFDIIFHTKGKKFRYQLSMIQNKIVKENLYLQEVPSVAKGTHALNHDIPVIFCVVLNQRTSSTPQSSAL